MLRKIGVITVLLGQTLLSGCMLFPQLNEPPAPPEPVGIHIPLNTEFLREQELAAKSFLEESLKERRQSLQRRTAPSVKPKEDRHV